MSRSVRTAATDARIWCLVLLLALWAPTLLRASPEDSLVADAAMRGDTETARSLLRSGADVNAAQADGMTALHWAALNDADELAEMLVYAGANLKAGTRNGNYEPLHLASRAGSVTVMATLLEAGADPNAPTAAGGARPLHFAAEIGNTEAIALLLHHGADIDAGEAAWRQTPLMFAAATGRVAAVNLLLQGGADPAVTSSVVDIVERGGWDRDEVRRRARQKAALRALEEEEQAAAEAEESEEAEEGEESEETREESAEEEETAEGDGTAEGEETVQGEEAVEGEETVQGGEAVEGEETADEGEAEPEGAEQRETSETEPAREVAVMLAEEAVAEPKEGAESEGEGEGESEEEEGKKEPAERPSFFDLVFAHGGLTALHYAAREGYTDTVLALLEAGADINQVSDGDQTSSLLISILNGHFDLALILLEAGANPQLASENGATPLYLALNARWIQKSSYPPQNAAKQQQATYLELMEALLTAGADPNVRLKKHLWYGGFNFDLLTDTTGATPFWRAAYATDVDAMKLLVAHGADPSTPTRKLPGRRRRGGNRRPQGDEEDHSGLQPVEIGGPAAYPIHAASGIGYGEGFAANQHRHVPDGWMAAVKYLIEEMGADINARDHNAYTPLHHAAARGDLDMVRYLVSHGADVAAVSRKGQTTADMANGPVQRIQPFPATLALLESLGAENNHNCVSC